MSTNETTAPSAADVLAAAFEEEHATPSTPAEPAGTPPEPQGEEPNEDAQGDEPAEAAKSEAPTSSFEPFKLPEGMAVDTALLEKATPVFEQMKLSQEQAQQLVDLYADAVAGQATALHEQQLAQRQAWINSVQKDKQLSDPFAMAGALKLVKEFGDKEFTALLDETGVGSHPAVVRFMQKVAAQFSEDKLVHGRTTPAPKERNPVQVIEDFIAGAPSQSPSE
jgi:predicted XRE-type DNA-binding protein